MNKRASLAKSQTDDLAEQADVFAQELKDDGIFPNSRLSLLVYRNAVLLLEQDPAASFERLFAENGWRDSWRNGIFAYHHYHSDRT